MNDCQRCDGEGRIDGAIETLDCPNCRDVCQWCNNTYDDGEKLGDTGLFVCRPCIRDMGDFKECSYWAIYTSVGLDNYLDDADELRADLDRAISDTFAEYGIETDAGGWDVRNPDKDD